MPKTSTKEPQLSREAWLQRALEVLRDEGIQGVRVERLARDLGVTKGSFYWHFADRDELWQGLLEFWSEIYNDVVTRNPEFQQGDAADVLLQAMTMIRHEGLDRFELAIRAWADHDPMADQAVRKVYAHRIEFISGLFRRMGFRGLEAEIRTRLTLCYLSWEPNMYPDETESRRLQMLKRQHALLTQK